MKNGIIYGGLIGLSFLIFSISNFYIDAQAFKIISPLLFFAAVITLVVMGLKSIKKSKYNGTVNYAQCLFNGVYIAGFAGISCALASVLFVTAIDTNYKEKAIAYERKLLEKENKTAAEIQSKLKEVESNQDIRKISGMAFLIFSFVVMIIVIISSSFIRNKDTFTGATPQS